MSIDLYFREPGSDNMYNPYTLEEQSPLEILLAKIRMILYTNRGEILSEPNLGMDLDDYIFSPGISEGVLRDRFYAQLAAYIPESADYNIDCNVTTTTDGISMFGNINIEVDGSPIFGVQI